MMENIKITFAENGTKTLATAGKYCDRNIDVEVEVAGGGGGSVEVEPIVLTGDCTGACAGAMAGTYIELFGDTVSTSDITKSSSMFNGTSLTNIPFALNYKSTTVSSPHSIDKMFQGASKLTEIPAMHNCHPQYFSYLFGNCYNLRSLPENFGADWDWTYAHTKLSNSSNYLFSNCYSLRSIPQSFLKNCYTATNLYFYSIYSYMFSGCVSLDEVRGLGVGETLSNDPFNGTFGSMCGRLKDITFDVNEDGTPKTANWANVTLELRNVGYTSASDKTKILNYNSGITADKEVTDDATYQALKDDPDWFTTKQAYARYNHDSAVNTINSLPDTSAYLTANGGTNTIKFRGATGELTDGGAINSLTEEEIAVATAKGWTVSFT